MADDILKKKVSLADLVKSASAEPDKNIGASPVPPVVFTKKVTKPVPTKTEQKPKSIVPVAVSQQPAVAQPAQPQTASNEPSWLSRMFTADKVEPGEYSTGRNVGEGIVQFLGNFGNSISGNAALNPALNQAFAQKRQEYMDMDPNSRSSVLYRGMAKTMGLPIRGDETAFTLKEQMPNVRDFLMARQMQSKGIGGGSAPKPLSGEQQKVVSNSSMALQAIADMRNALKKGTNTFSLIGDNDYTEARRRFAEGFGRLQSGGVIGAEELQNFEALAPKVTDSKEQQQAKLDRMEAELRSRIKLAGIEPTETGSDRSEASAKNQIKYVRDKTTGKTLKVNGLGEVLE
jgi:hypothetical protein